MGRRTAGATRRALLAGIGGILSAAAGCLGGSGSEWDAGEPLAVASATQYQDPACACCGEYAEYVDERIDAKLEVVEPDDLAERKRSLGVPDDLRSCHTAVLDGLFVEGHVPVEPIDAALADDAVVGLALPGMPSASPGMGGEVDGALEVYAVGDDGRWEAFWRG